MGARLGARATRGGVRARARRLGARAAGALRARASRARGHARATRGHAGRAGVGAAGEIGAVVRGKVRPGGKTSAVEEGLSALGVLVRVLQHGGVGDAVRDMADNGGVDTEETNAALVVLHAPSGDVVGDANEVVDVVRREESMGEGANLGTVDSGLAGRRRGHGLGLGASSGSSADKREKGNEAHEDEDFHHLHC